MLSWIFIELAHWNNSLQINPLTHYLDSTLLTHYLDPTLWHITLIQHSDTLPWFNTLTHYLDSTLWHITLIQHSDTLPWFKANLSLFLLLNAVCLLEKQQIPILKFLVWPDLRSTTLKTSTLTLHHWCEFWKVAYLIYMCVSSKS